MSTLFQASLGFNTRPMRVAYFIDGDDPDLFSQVAAFCCTQWGGIHNFIVPVVPKGVPGEFLQALDSHPPDLVVTACEAQIDAFNAFLASYFGDAHPPLWHWQRFQNNDPTIFTLHLFESQRRQGIRLPTLAVPRFEGPTDSLLHACDIAAFGAMSDRLYETYQMMMDVLPMPLPPDGVGFLHQQFARGAQASPINLTGTDLDFHLMEAAPATWHFDIVVPVSVSDICWFWCLRAVSNLTHAQVGHRRTLLIPPTLFRRAAFRETLYEALRPRLAHPNVQSSLDINFVTSDKAFGAVRGAIRRSEKAGQLEKLDPDDVRFGYRFSVVEDLKPAPRHSHQAPLNYMVNFLFGPPGRYREGIDYTVPKLLEFRYGRNQLYIPPNTRLPHNAGLVMLDMEGDLWDRYPTSRSVANAIIPDSVFTHYGLSRSIYSSQGERLWEFNLPAEIDAIQMFLSDHGYESSLSQTSRLGAALFSLMGGIEGCSYLRQRPVYEVVDALAMPSTSKVAQDLAGLLQGRVGSISSLSREALIDALQEGMSDAQVAPQFGRAQSTLKDLRERGGLKQRSPAEILGVLEELIKRRTVLRGMSIVCPVCGVREWYPLGASGDFVECPGCFDLHPVSASVGGQERRLEYALNTALNTAMDQGAIVNVLLATALSAKGPPIYGIVLGLDLREKDRNHVLGDFDLIFVRKQKVYAAECKRGSYLEDNKIALARRARDAGCAGFYFASLEGFDATVQAKISRLRDELSESPEFAIEVLGRDELLLP